MNSVEAALKHIARALQRERSRWAVVGGLAVSVRAEPRTTRDVDVAVATAGDDDAELLVRTLFDAGFRPAEQGVLENRATGRLATVRVVAPGQDADGVVVDLLFESSGIEAEVVAMAEAIEVLPGIELPVARTGHLLALKILAGRAKDIADAVALARAATPTDVELARSSFGLMRARHCDRGRDLDGILDRVLLGEPIEVVG